MINASHKIFNIVILRFMLQNITKVHWYWNIGKQYWLLDYAVANS